MRTPPRGPWLIASAGIILVTALLLLVREELAITHVALAYLMLVLVVSSRGGARPGVTTSLAGFLCFNFFFVPPYYELTVASPLDWAVLVAFLGASLVAAQLLARVRREAASASARAAELDVKNAVLASVSHDLRTPLTTIKALAHEIRVEGSDGDGERAAVIEEEADRLNRFVSDLLDLSRLAVGALRVSPEINAAEDLIGAALQRVSGTIGDRQLAASLDPREPLLVGRFDFVQSLRVLGNLLDNAVKFAPPGSTIELTARRVGGELEFVVSDRGPGVPTPDRESIFQPFVRHVDASAAPGVGLGLSIARALAEAQGGSVQHVAREEGGSRFVFRVPGADLSQLDAETRSSL